MKFVQSEVQLAEGSSVIYFQSDDFKITASKHGVVLLGTLSITKQDHLEILALFLGKAWQHHLRMKHVE